MKKFFKENWVLIAILLIGSFFRLDNIAGYMTFLGDEGRDVIIVRNLLVHADPILIGPGTSVGGMYLGPLYYYFMAPFLFLAGYSPIGPAIGVALLGIATIFLVFMTGRDWFSKKTGLIAAALFSISPTVITYSHSSWNPNIMPFFALLSIYSIWKVYAQKKYIWLLVTAVSFAFVLQSHYLGILLTPVLVIYYILSVRQLRVDCIAMRAGYGLENSPLATRNFNTQSLASLLVFLFLMSPLLIFDIRHDWMNSRALYKFLTVREETLSIGFWSVFPKIYTIFSDITISLLTAKNILLGKLVSLILLIYIIFFKKNKTFWYIISWLIFGVIGLALYKGSIYDHYLGFLFPAPFLLVGIFLNKVHESKYRIFSILIFSILVFVNLINNPFRHQPNYQMKRSINVANKILEIVDGKPFNLAVLAERNYEDGYRYFMEVAGAKVMHADRWDQKTIVDTLMVICEKPEKDCDPTHSPKAEVANFGWSKIESQWTVDGVIIYKLTHSKPVNQ